MLTCPELHPNEFYKYKMMPHRYTYKCPVCDRKDVLNIVLHLKTVHRANANDWLFEAKLLYLIVV